MIEHIAFIESLVDVEQRGDRGQWRELLAGILVLRLYRLCVLEPSIARRDSPPVVAVGHVVASLSHAPAVQGRLRAIVDALSARRGWRETARAVEAYGALLAEQGEKELSRTVLDMVAGELN